MIKSGEISRQANSLGVRDKQVEKDYIISWVLKSLSENLFLSENLVFKGGTCLKKIYFTDLIKDK